MTFKEMTTLVPELRELQLRIRAVIKLIDGYHESDKEDLEDIFGHAPDLILDRKRLCFSRFEASCVRSLMALAGPDGFHPSLKDPECYSIAHNFLWKNFPICRHDGDCDSTPQEIVSVDFRDEESA